MWGDSRNGLGKRVRPIIIGSAGVGQFCGGTDFGGELLLLFRQGAEIALHLNAVPELGGLAKEGVEADRHGWSDRALAKDDFVDGAGATPMARAMAFCEIPMG